MVLRRIKRKLARLTAPASTAHVDTGGESGRFEHWLLIFNCQARGLANCLNLVTDEVRVEYYTSVDYHRQSREILRRWETFDRVLVAPQFLHLLPDELAGSDKVWSVPTVSFRAYHPDICYLTNEGKPLKGPLDDYHSIIAYAGFKLGLSVEAVRSKFNEDTYDRLGYFNRWDADKKRLLDTFNQAGYNLAQPLADWTRMGSFMYSLNHVKVNCLMDIAKAILTRAGNSIDYLDVLPHDNLVNGPVYPVYPEIGIRLGVRGNYLFKRGGTYAFIRLDQYLEQCFSLYARARELAPIPEHTKMVEHAMLQLGEDR